MNRKERRAQDAQNKKVKAGGNGNGGMTEDEIVAAGGDKKGPASALVTKEAIAATRALVDNGYYAEAKELFQILLELDPTNFHLQKSYAITLLANEDIKLAREAFERLDDLLPGNEDSITGLASCAIYLENNEEALSWLNKLEGRDLAIMTLNQIAHLYNNLGNIDKALACLRTSINKQPMQTAAYYEMHNMKKFKPDEPDVQSLQKLAQNPEILPERDHTMLHYTLGKVYLDLGDAEKGFEHYTRANKLKRDTLKVNSTEMMEKYFDSITKIFDADFVKKFKNAGSITSDRPIFIVGMPRSGSTLTDQILSSHPDVASFGEKNLMTRCIPVVLNTEVQGLGLSHTTGQPISPTITRGLLEAITPEALDIMGNNYLKKTDIFAKDGALRVVDKMLFNHIWVGLIRLMLPNAKIIHCMRDPVDTGFSIWKLWFAGNIPWAYDLQDIGRYYNAHKKLMDHWHKLFPGEIFVAKYEDMVADQKGQSRKLLEFCGLPWDDRVLNFYESERTVKTASLLQVRKPIYTDSVKKWKKYEKYLQPLIEEVAKSGEYPYDDK